MQLLLYLSLRWYKCCLHDVIGNSIQFIQYESRKPLNTEFLFSLMAIQAYVLMALFNKILPDLQHILSPHLANAPIHWSLNLFLYEQNGYMCQYFLKPTRRSFKERSSFRKQLRGHCCCGENCWNWCTISCLFLFFFCHLLWPTVRWLIAYGLQRPARLLGWMCVHVSALLTTKPRKY